MVGDHGIDGAGLEEADQSLESRPAPAPVGGQIVVGEDLGHGEAMAISELPAGALLAVDAKVLPVHVLADAAVDGGCGHAPMLSVYR